MTVIHATDFSTHVLSLLYQQRGGVRILITERSTSSDVQRAIRADDVIMMLGHGNDYGLFSKPDKNGEYRRFLITDRHVQFLRDKTCMGIWCYANKFAEKYRLHGRIEVIVLSCIGGISRINCSQLRNSSQDGIGAACAKSGVQREMGHQVARHVLHAVAATEVDACQRTCNLAVLIAI